MASEHCRQAAAAAAAADKNGSNVTQSTRETG